MSSTGRDSPRRRDSSRRGDSVETQSYGKEPLEVTDSVYEDLSKDVHSSVMDQLTVTMAASRKAQGKLLNKLKDKQDKKFKKLEKKMDSGLTQINQAITLLSQTMSGPQIKRKAHEISEEEESESEDEESEAEQSEHDQNDQEEGEIVDEEKDASPENSPVKANADVEKRSPLDIFYRKPTTTAPAVHNSIQKHMEEFWQQPDLKHEKQLLEEYVAPENCRDMTVPEVEEGLWKSFKASVKTEDLVFRRVQKILIASQFAIMPVLEHLMNEKNKDDEYDVQKDNLLRGLTDSTKLIAMAHKHLCDKRIESFREELDGKHKQLARKPDKITGDLLGGNLAEKLKTIEETPFIQTKTRKREQEARKRRKYTRTSHANKPAGFSDQRSDGYRGRGRGRGSNRFLSGTGGRGQYKQTGDRQYEAPRQDQSYSKNQDYKNQKSYQGYKNQDKNKRN